MNATAYIPLRDRQSWVRERRNGIGASDVPAILGLTPWKSPFQVWAEKTGYLEEDDLSDNEAVEFGIRLERPIAEAYAERTGRRVVMWPQYHIVRHPQFDWLRCTPDATQFDEVRGEGLLQIKSTNEYKSADWADGPPLMHQVQVQAEMAVTGKDYNTLVVLIGGQRLRYYDCERNDRFISALIPKLEAFWRMVETRTEPPVDGSLVTAKVLARLHPDDNGEVIQLSHEAVEWTETIQRAKEEIKALEALKSEAENQLRAAIGDATFGLLPDGSRWSWKTQNRAGYTVEPTKCRILRKVK